MLEEEGIRKKIILASASPRRRDILKLLKLDFEVIEPKNCEERQFKNPYRTVIQNSIIKAKNVYNYIKEYSLEKQGLDNRGGFLIAGFDTVIYIDKEDVLDKAGAYNIFGFGSLLVEKINGCFYNVAGLPVVKFTDLLKEFKFNIIG